MTNDKHKNTHSALNGKKLLTFGEIPSVWNTDPVNVKDHHRRRPWMPDLRWMTISETSRQQLISGAATCQQLGTAVDKHKVRRWTWTCVFTPAPAPNTQRQTNTTAKNNHDWTSRAISYTTKKKKSNQYRCFQGLEGSWMPSHLLGRWMKPIGLLQNSINVKLNWKVNFTAGWSAIS